MAYNKPGVEVTYVQASVSPNLTEPDLQAVILGPAYYVHEIAESPDSIYTDTYYQTYNNSLGNSGVNAITLSGMEYSSNVDNNSIYVDLISTIGNRTTLTLTTHFTYAAGAVSLLPGIGSTWTGARVKIGYRERRDDLTNLYSLASTDEIENRLGNISISNPIAFGVYQTMVNAGVAVFSLSFSGTNEATSYSNAIDTLALDDRPYYLVPLTNTATIHTSLQTHADSMSSPTNKKERIVIAPRAINWKKADNSAATGPTASDMDKTQTVTSVAVDATSNQNRRSFWVYPDTCFVYQRAHISTLKRSYLDNLNGTKSLNAITTSNIRLSDGTIIYTGSEITDALQSSIAGDGVFWLNALVPVYNWYLAAAIAGQKSGNRPEQPVTNVPIGGISRLKYSGDFFSETQLNLAANGGTYWMYQQTVTSPIVCRHQLSTDRSSVQRQEFSITTALDFVGKFIRNGVSFYIGRYNITPAFLKMLRMVVSSQGQYLVREGYLNSFTLNTLEVDSIASDTILCTITVGVKFPVNYIKFTLIF